MEDTLASQKIRHKYEKFATITSYFFFKKTTTMKP